MPLSRKKQDYNNKFVRENYKHYYLRIRYDKDKELIAHLENLPNKNEYIRNLIAKDIKTQD